MRDQRQVPREEEMPEPLHCAHPSEPAEGPREPDDGASANRVPHPEEPADGDRPSASA